MSLLTGVVDTLINSCFNSNSILIGAGNILDNLEQGESNWQVVLRIKEFLGDQSSLERDYFRGTLLKKKQLN